MQKSGVGPEMGRIDEEEGVGPPSGCLYMGCTGNLQRIIMLNSAREAELMDIMMDKDTSMDRYRRAFYEYQDMLFVRQFQIHQEKLRREYRSGYTGDSPALKWIKGMGE